MQRQFSKVGKALGLLTLAALVVAAHAFNLRIPTRSELGPRPAQLLLTKEDLDGARFAPLRLMAAWRLRSEDPRLGGVSALAIDGPDLLALTDSGVVLRFAMPRRSGPVQATVRELPGGPGPREFKKNRDSEAIAADPQGRGWWVAFENRNALWLYDRNFERALHSRKLPPGPWAGNHGVEAMVPRGDGLRLFAERPQGRLIPWRREVSDAALLPDGRIARAERRIGPLGIANHLVIGGRRHPLPVGHLDIVEAIAAERSANGAIRLWLMTDNNGHERRDTLLLAVELPPGV